MSCCTKCGRNHRRKHRRGTFQICILHHTPLSWMTRPTPRTSRWKARRMAAGAYPPRSRTASKIHASATFLRHQGTERNWDIERKWETKKRRRHQAEGCCYCCCCELGTRTPASAPRSNTLTRQTRTRHTCCASATIHPPPSSNPLRLPIRSWRRTNHFFPLFLRRPPRRLRSIERTRWSC